MSDSKLPTDYLSNVSLTPSQVVGSKHTSFEFETIRSKEVQTCTNGTDHTDTIPKCKRQCIRKKKRKIAKPEECQTYPCQAVCLDEEVCRKHSFCVVDGLRQHGCKPLYPKGLPWASGKLLYYPGQRPKYLGIMRETPQEISRIQQAKKRKKQKAKREKEAALKSLRQADDEKLCDIVGTSQEMMLLMRALALVTQQRKRDRTKTTASTEPDVFDEEQNEAEEDKGEEENAIEENQAEEEQEEEKGEEDETEQKMDTE
ncbi:hypothetical protein LSTR_LSTR007883 [Laodelphax striatellus]|uniref:Uncharacterized protein n=1 Tax=Laodelphax striatellus TaxID=195883 RepID=A0A482XQ27_LAOST|nr:hypothetical protein LSTR_LSTR007883 [Laodelphax striatellus]